MDAPLFTTLIVRFIPYGLISSRRIWALCQEMGRLGIDGMLVPSVRVLFSYDG